MAEKDLIRFAEYLSPSGAILIAGGEKGITALSLTAGRGLFLGGIKDKYGYCPREDKTFFKDAFAQLDTYFSGSPMEFTLPLDLKGSVFELKVWRAIRDIPWGQTLSYKEIALRAGSPAASRAAGGACGKNPVPLIVPCHRVLGSSDSLGGYTGGLEIKKMLLKIEGVLP
jgi:O-6-methylguanine DNA methyltransferase